MQHDQIIRLAYASLDIEEVVSVDVVPACFGGWVGFVDAATPAMRMATELATERVVGSFIVVGSSRDLEALVMVRKTKCSLLV